MKIKIRPQEPEQPDFENQQEIQYRDNAEINAKIDAYIHDHPKRLQYVQSLPRERLERKLMLHEAERVEYAQKRDQRLLQEIEKNPELKQTFDRLVRDLPEQGREKMTLTIARCLLPALRQTQEAPAHKMAA